MISVIVPVYNVENVLPYCVDSILNQTNKDFELILVDDGSIDSSGAVCDAYAEKDARVRAIHQANGGVSKARNAGIEAARGEFICFVDSDDYVDVNYLKALVDTKRQYPYIDNIWCGMQTVDGYTEGIILQRAVFSDEETVSYSSRKYIMDLHEKWLDAGPVCKLYSLSTINNNNLRFDETLSLGEDLIFNFQYLDCTNGEIAVINKCLYSYLQVSSETLGSRYYDDMFGIYKKINAVMLKYITKWKCDDRQFAKYYNACFYKYEVVLQNTYREHSRIRRKGRYNRFVMNSPEFQEALNRSDCFIHSVYKKIYQYGMSYTWALLIKLTPLIKKH